jgi:hypothetical protein
VIEVGYRLSPSSIFPSLRLPMVGAYVLYAVVCIAVLRRLERAEQSQ